MTWKQKAPEESSDPAFASAEGRYVAFFDAFNQGRFFEAHEVLEPVWLADRQGRDGAYYKGLIQLAGAFVHVQKGRYAPARSLLLLARTNLEKFGPDYRGLNLETVRHWIFQWLEAIERTRADLKPLLPELPILKPAKLPS